MFRKGIKVVDLETTLKLPRTYSILSKKLVKYILLKKKTILFDKILIYNVFDYLKNKYSRLI